LDKVEALLERVAARRPRVIDLSLDRVFAALERLGDPHKNMPPVFHVAGTNGKGSTIAFLRSILEAAGKSVHVYTSPHLVRFNERIVVAGREIGDDALIDALERCDRAVGEEKLTYFETTTCAALLAFAETPADFALIEVGLGGRLDATNVFDRPLAALIAPVDLDHQQFLGDSLSLIAAEKAGILRPGAPAVVGVQAPAAMATIEARAVEVGAPLFAFGRQWQVYAEHGRMIYQDEAGLCDLDPPRLPGSHQIANAGLAVAGLRAAGLGLADGVVSQGIASARWPARLQRLTCGPIVDLAETLIGAQPEIWLDGGHNPHAGRAVAAALAGFEERNSKPLVMIAGMQAKKDAEGYFSAFAGLASKLYAVAADHPGVAAAEDVARAAQAAGLDAECAGAVEAALRRACTEKYGEPPRLLISGSLYLAGEILRENG